MFVRHDCERKSIMCVYFGSCGDTCSLCKYLSAFVRLYILSPSLCIYLLHSFLENFVSGSVTLVSASSSASLCLCLLVLIRFPWCQPLLVRVHICFGSMTKHLSDNTYRDNTSPTIHLLTIHHLFYGKGDINSQIGRAHV